MRVASMFVLAAAAWTLAGCDMRLAQPEPGGVPRQVQEIIESRSITDQEIAESAAMDPAGCLWPPLPDPAYSVYAVAFVWGHLLDPRMPPFPVVDWSGELSVSVPGSGIKVLRTIDFEDGEDKLLPAVEPTTIGWVSQTAGDYDGLGLLIRVAEASATDARVPELSFKTPPFAITLPFSKLERFLAYYPVSETDGVAVLARRVDRLACPRGSIVGEWVPDAVDGSRGWLTGMWYNLFGIPIGSMAGSFSTDPDGERRFEGWLSGVWLTVVLTEFKGTWTGKGSGAFEGRYQYLNSKETGILSGEFGGDASLQAQRRLPLKGVWRADCVVITPDPAEAGP
jgi:hypothetical protein